METQLIHGVHLAIDYFNSVPGHWLYTIGVVVASIPLSALVVQGVKKLHFKWTATEMTNHFIDFVVLVTGFLMAGADFVITNGNNVKYLPQFLLVVVPTIKALAPSVYTYSKAIHSWFVNRQSEDQKQRLNAVLSAADVVAPVVNGSGTPQPPKPSPNLLQL
jgi:hypothetical protein